MALPPATTPVALRWGAALAALVFAVHPLRVESVASATERRDVLSGLFYVLALLCYVKAATTTPSGPATRLHPRWYGLSLACFAAGLLSKSIVVTLPVTLLVLDVYPLRRLGGPAGWRTPRPWLEKLPFFALSAAAVVVAFLALLTLDNMRSLQSMPLLLRPWYPSMACFSTCRKPSSPSISLPVPAELPGHMAQLGDAGASVCFAWACRHRWPALTAAPSCTWSPSRRSSGFQNGPQAAADRYTYLACLGWALLIGGALARWWPQRRMLAPIAAAWLAALAFLTWQQTGLWKDPITLWSHAAMVTPGMRVAYFKLGEAYAKDGKTAEAIGAYREAMRLSGPSAPWGHVAIARLLEQSGLDEAARAEFAEALREDPTSREACEGMERLVKRRASFAPAPPSCTRRGS
jgi:hypothetical protein